MPVAGRGRQSQDYDRAVRHVLRTRDRDDLHYRRRSASPARATIANKIQTARSNQTVGSRGSFNRPERPSFAPTIGSEKFMISDGRTASRDERKSAIKPFGGNSSSGWIRSLPRQDYPAGAKGLGQTATIALSRLVVTCRGLSRLVASNRKSPVAPFAGIRRNSRRSYGLPLCRSRRIYRPETFNRSCSHSLRLPNS